MNILICLLFLALFDLFGNAASLLGAQTFNQPASMAVSLSEENIPLTESGLPAIDEAMFFNRKLINQTFVKQRKIILTFDDGPHPINTPYILDVLKKLNAKAIFFVVGVNVRKYPGIVKRIADEGHTLGNHTYYHLNLRHHSLERILSEINSTNQLVQSITGVKPTLFRPPYGAINQKILEVIKAEGMSVMLWSVDPGDWRNRNITKTMANLKRQLAMNNGGSGKGGIVLLHDTLTSSAHALEPFLRALIEIGQTPDNFAFADGRRGKSYWKTTPPSIAYWQELEPVYNVRGLGIPLLTIMLERPAPAPYSPLAMLKAKKSRDYFRNMICQSFR
ncbi:MAG: polysaccharide deacetylase family protein [Candidatus Riflebacteria bacterium]|nr:polysaccharide deacetylase family protein [Candidatus Riflebacteria bacterium]